MFIPIWILHVIVTILFLVTFFGWAFRSYGTWDFMPPIRGLLVLLGYAIYWIVVLVITVCTH
jgi:hypothetical protein